MRVVVFCHSLVSDWNHGNAHFLRGIASELLHRGCDVAVYEPRDGWSRSHLIAEGGPSALEAFRSAYPELRSMEYDPAAADLDALIGAADVVLVHEWNEPGLVKRIGAHRRRCGGYVLLFHDTHHRSVTDPKAMAAFDLTGYDGVLAFGDVVGTRYRERGWAARTWTWHEAADTRRFTPDAASAADLPSGDLVWVGNWGDEERTAELDEFLIQPVKRLGLSANVFGVRFPAHAIQHLRAHGLIYRGWLPNHLVPAVFARHRLTIHVPRRPYLDALPGIPTIRPFEALACGIPLVCARWDRTGGTFTPGLDYLVAWDGGEMIAALSRILREPALAARLRAHGLATVRSRHTCRHRVDELFSIVNEIRHGDAPAPAVFPSVVSA